MSWNVIWEAVKEPLRLMVLSVIPVLLAYLGTLSYEWAAVLIVILRLVDSMLHEVGKTKGDAKLVTGLTRF